MTKSNILIESSHEFKRARRNVIFRLFAFLGIVGLAAYLFTPLSQIEHVQSIDELFHGPAMDWVSRALPSSIPFKCAHVFNLLQLFFAVALVTSDHSRLTRLDTLEALRVHAQGNAEISAGNIAGKVLAFSMINGLTFALCGLLNFLFYPDAFNAGYYFFYWATLNLPTLVFCIGLSTLVARMARNQGVCLIILAGILGGMTLPGADWLNGLFDPLAANVPNLFSDFTGHVNLAGYLSQRAFILLSGCGLAVLAVIPYPRIHNRPGSPLRLAGIALLPMVGATVLAGEYHLHHRAVEENRETYRAAYARHAGEEPLKIIGNDLLVRETGDGGIAVTSRMTVVNGAAVARPLVLYLNPGLKVSAVSVNGRNVEFQRDQQVLLPAGVLAPDDTSRVTVSYEGRIDNSLCFLDTPPEKFDSPGVNSIGMYRFGYTPAFCGKGYKLLTPECTWYPVSIPPYDSMGFRRAMFTRYSLEVEHDPRLMAISQGNDVERLSGKTTFSFDHDMAGVSLCIGDYKRRVITVDSTRVELFYSPDHESMLEQYEGIPGEELLEIFKDEKSGMEYAQMETTDYKKKRQSGKVAFDPTLQYPYRWLTLVEVPCDFHAFTRRTRLTGERVQGGIVFLPEKKYSIDVSFRVYEDKERESRAHLNDEFDMFRGEGCDLKPTLRGYTSFIHSVEYPVINDVLALALSRWFSLKEENKEYPVVEYLKDHSLEEALRDPALSPGSLDLIIRKKSEELKALLSIRVGKEELHRAYHDFLVKHLFEETTLEEFSREFLTRFDTGLDSIVERWFRNDRLPLLEITDGRAIIRGEECIASFKIFNRGEVSGIILMPDNRGWIIPPGEGRDIRIRYEEKYFFSHVETILALNLPTQLELPQEKGDAYTDTTTWFFPIVPSPIAPKNDNEIVVENEDPGFKIVENGKFNLASLLGKVETRARCYNYIPIDHWGFTIHARYHGEPVKGAFLKQAGEGKQKVQWEARLPREGKYEVFSYLPFDEESLVTSPFDFSRKYYYTVFDGKEEHEAVLAIDKDAQGWMSLGVFDFHGNARVTLSDRDRECDPSKVYTPQIVVADAMKWVKVQE